MSRAAGPLLALALSVAPMAARATTVVPVTAEELTQRSDEVVLATVRASSSRWERGLIVTDHELTVDAAVDQRTFPQPDLPRADEPVAGADDGCVGPDGGGHGRKGMATLRPRPHGTNNDRPVGHSGGRP